MGGLWDALEARLRAVDPDLAGLGPPAPPSVLEAFDVPLRWRDLWAGHDGQTGALDGLFEGWFFLPLEGTTDTVREELERLPHHVRDGWFPLAKDFSGEIWVVERATDRVLHVSGDEVQDLVASSPEELLKRALAGWDREGLPRTWSIGPDGRWRRDGEPEVSLAELAEWEVGEQRPLVEGLVAVRLFAPAVLAPDDLPDDRRHLVFAVDAVDGDPERRGKVVSAALDGALGYTLCSRGDLWWIEGERIPATARVRLRLDPGARGAGRGPLGDLAQARSPRERARALYHLGALTRALEALGPADPELETTLLVLLGRPGDALVAAERLAPGLPARVRALSAAGRHAEALAEVEVHLAEIDPRVGDRWLAADILEAAGARDAAADALEPALRDELPLSRDAGLRVSARVRALRGRAPTPSEGPPVMSDDDLVDDVTLDGRVAVVRLTPRQAELGVLVQVPFPEGPVAVRLPKAAGHGARARFSPDGRELVVEVHLRPPAGWTPTEGAANRTLAFDRWDVIAPVERTRAKRVRVAGLDGPVDVEWPAEAAEVRVPGQGLPRPGGGRGDLVVKTS